ncbi:MAG: ABC transporter ATP-binding protein [Nitrososphaerota archaeon]
MGAIVEVRRLVKRYKENVLALRGVNIDIDRDEFFVIMGPSGCGKSTLLKVIAGILDYDEGELYINGKNMKNVPAHKRDISLMLENYALFPHMNVFDNVAFGLRMLNKDATEIERDVREILALLELKGLEKRFPNEISGGQRQRVALARALVINPSVLLLDEPLSHIDYRLQRRFAALLKDVHRQIGGTAFVLTTHDQHHGLSLADRMAIMNSGLIEQTGRPDDIYNEPQTLFAARFVGEVNTFMGEVQEVGVDSVWVKTNIGYLKCSKPNGAERFVGQRVAYFIRPEKVSISSSQEKVDNSIECYFEYMYYFGHFVELIFRTSNNMRIKSVTQTHKLSNFNINEKYWLSWRAVDARIISKPSVVEGVDIEDLIYGR